MTAVTVSTIAALAAGVIVVLWRTSLRTKPARAPRPLETNRTHLYRLDGGGVERRLGVVTGDLRRVRSAQVWVNPENTEMRMARVDEFSVSAIIRHEGARRDATGRITSDLIVDELDRLVGSRRPVPAGTAIVTGAGALARFGVRYVVHSAAVHGEPGAGYRQVREVGRCVTAVLAAIDRIDDHRPVESVLFPLLGAGQGGGDPRKTAVVLTSAVTDYLAATPTSSIRTVHVLAYTDVELDACFEACKRLGLRPIAGEQVQDAPVLTAADTGDGIGGVPANPAEPLAKTLHIGFSIDVVGFGSRPAPGRDAVQQRLVRLLRGVLADAGIDLDQVRHEWLGDGASVYLPNDLDPSRALAVLVTATSRRLAEDNRAHADRVRLRMAMTLGLMGPGETGFSGPLAVELARMTDAAPLRRAIADEPRHDLAVLVSDYLYTHVVRLGYADLPAAAFRRVDVAVKEFTAPAWLWLPGSTG
ncbi:macro domain-containing protein [Saccharothrix deserti]|uniref:macro domain-containing protein n=1 Tax=Saccharothrix deserti TaxID=2593674 RepID=UPI00131DCEE3|nr:macro domain-containing protein [Saccharothrix deserti]